MNKKKFILRNRSKQTLRLIIEPEYASYDLLSEDEVLICCDTRSDTPVIDFNDDNCISIHTDADYAVLKGGVTLSTVK